MSPKLLNQELHFKMATSRDLEPPETECPVCQNTFVDPKILPCGHLLCRSCVVSLITSRIQPNCPLCRHTFVDPIEQVIRTSENIADKLPTDFALGALAASVDLLAKEPVCCVCDGVKAESICAQCQMMLCSACTTAHKKIPVTRNHDMEFLSTMTPERLAASRTALCADHGEKQSHFCSSHGVAVCAFCVVANHRLCPEVKDLDSEANAADQGLKSLTSILADAEERLEETISKLDIRLNESTSCKNMIKKARDILLSIFTKKEEAISNSTKSVENARQTLRNRLTVVRSHKGIFARTKKICPRPGVIYARQALQQRLKTLDLKTALPPDVNTLVRMTDYCDLLRQAKIKIRELEKHTIKFEAKLSQQKQLTFHTNRGNGVVLSFKRMQAASVAIGGVVVSSEALEPYFLYTLKVLEMDRHWQPDYIQFFGVTGTHPNDLNIKSSFREMEDVSTFCGERNGVFIMDLKVNSTITLRVGPNSTLNLHAENKKVVMPLDNVPRPWYAVFDLGINVRKVHALPVY